MSETPEPSTISSGSAAGGDANAPDAQSSEVPVAPPRPSAAQKLGAHPKVQQAIALAKKHPVGTVATVAAAAAIVEIPFAVGLLAGLGASTLIHNKPEQRAQMVARGKEAIAKARLMLPGRRPPSAPAPKPPAADMPLS